MEAVGRVTASCRSSRARRRDPGWRAAAAAGEREVRAVSSTAASSRPTTTSPPQLATAYNQCIDYRTRCGGDDKPTGKGIGVAVIDTVMTAFAR